MTALKENQKKYIFAVWLQELIVITLCFFYLLIRVQPVLIPEFRTPVFINGTEYLQNLLAVPGGIMDWLSAFLMQFWVSDAVGALCLACFLWLLTVISRKWIETISGSSPVHTLQLIPALFFTIQLSLYSIHLNSIFSLIFNLLALILLDLWISRNGAIRIISAIAFSCLLFWATGGAFLYFTVLAALEDLLLRKRYLSGFILLAASAVLPFMASSTIFVVTHNQAYIHNLPIEGQTETLYAAYGLLFFYPLVITGAFLLQVKKVKTFLGRFAYSVYLIRVGVGTVVIILLAIIALQRTTESIQLFKSVFQTNRFARHGLWPEVLMNASHSTNPNILLACQTNRGLYHRGVLLDSMFSYKQTFGLSGLLFNKEWCQGWPEEASELYLDIGFVNEAEHWAQEAIEIKGISPSLLRQLGIVFMLKGNHETASRYFNILRKIPLQAAAVDSLIACNNDPSVMARTADFLRIGSSIPEEDVITLGRPPLKALESIVKKNPANTMAFEYLMAAYLLNGDLKEIWKRAADFAAAKNGKLPRHIQEALIVYTVLNKEADRSTLDRWVSTASMNSFSIYEQVLRKYHGNKNNAQQALHMQFGNTYWYYIQFLIPPVQPMESQNDFQ
ncbi:MAG: hypothetical protein JXA06_11725 [Bacteroidetes bacterium]|nr:hypothetical protein [Bacteroidota bacterium]